ncbi:MAG: RIP metalloprotease RseP [Candidatus Bipolaricaulota bacterium]|nr:RIP metalloprotease RseP [Candidatus Bipolaricaulota bacterium]
MITFLVFVGTILILVGVHEGGHFVVAKLTGVYVHEFAIGFGPKLLMFHGRETNYSLRLLPFGGYVRMAGENKEETSTEIPNDRLLYNKPPFVRILISLAGPTLNLLMAFSVGLVIAWSFGVPYLQVAELVSGSPAAPLLELGDRVLKVNDQFVSDMEELGAIIQQEKGDPVQFTIERDDELYTVDVTPRFDQQEGRWLVGVYFYPITYTNRLMSLTPDSPLAGAGLKSGDRIIAVAGESVKSYIGLINRLDERAQADAVQLRVRRGRDEIELRLPTTGIELPDLLSGATFANLGIDHHRPGLFSGFALAGQQFADYINLTVLSVRGILTGRIPASEAIAGPVGIAELLGKGLKQGASTFLSLFSILSLSLGLLNLIPFPPLDGSRVAFALYELVTRRPIPPQREGLIHTIGALILISLLLLITYQDILRLFQ